VIESGSGHALEFMEPDAVFPASALDPDAGTS
jgi:hypothetical protein